MRGVLLPGYRGAAQPLDITGVLLPGYRGAAQPLDITGVLLPGYRGTAQPLDITGVLLPGYRGAAQPVDILITDKLIKWSFQIFNLLRITNDAISTVMSSYIFHLVVLLTLIFTFCFVIR